MLLWERDGLDLDAMWTHTAIMQEGAKELRTKGGRVGMQGAGMLQQSLVERRVPL